MTNSKSARRNLNGKGNTSAVSLAKPTSPGRHEYHCRTCSHSKRVEIEQAFVTWSSPVRISKEYGVYGPDSNIELTVYFVVSPERGAARRIFNEENIQASGGIHAIERTLESENYWFVRLGEIRAEAGSRGVTFSDTEFSKLTVPPEDFGDQNSSDMSSGPFYSRERRLFPTWG
jgi:hypothetical protein